MSSRNTLNKATGLTGLLMSRNPHFTLTTLYTKILGTLKKMPEEAAYRKHTEKIVSERLSIVSSEKDIQKVAERIDSGLPEELILQAENELHLARRMIQFRPWEPLVEQPPPNQWKWPI